MKKSSVLSFLLSVILALSPALVSGAPNYGAGVFNSGTTVAAGSGSGSVTSTSVVTGNGFAGTVANATTTPAITLTTTVTGLVKGNGTLLSAATAGTDYQAPITLTTTGSSGAATFTGGTLNIPQYSGGGGSVSITSLSPALVLSPSTLTGTGTITEAAAISSTCGSSATCTILSTDLGMIVQNNRTSSQAVTLPQCNSGSFTINSSFIDENISTGIATVTAAGGSLINGSPTSTTTLAVYPDQSAFLHCDASGNWNVALGGAPLPALVANQVLGSLTAVAPTGLSVPSCSGASNALTWTSGTGFGCNTIAGSGTINNGTTGQFAKYTGTNTISGSTVLLDSGTSLTSSESIAITSTASTALTVGTNGTTTPILTVDDSTASAVAGLAIKGAATGGTVTLTATDSGSNTGITLSAKGTGSTNINSPSGNVNLQLAGSARLAVAATQISITPASESFAALTHLAYTGAADTSITASTEANVEQWNNAQIRQWSTGALALQRDFYIIGATDSFAGASTLTDAATLGFKLPGCGTNATCTDLDGIYHGSTALTVTGTTANSYAINVASDTGATNNYAAKFVGDVQLAPAAALPTVSTCGSGSLATGSGDNKGQVTGITAATSCTITFAYPLTAAPACNMTTNAGINPTITTISTTAVTFTMTALTGTLYYICF